MSRESNFKTRKKRVREELTYVTVEAIAAEGKALAHIDGKVLFLSNAIPGDVVDVVLTKKKKSFMEGYIKQIVTPSPNRIEPFCDHFGVCGGCKWQHLPYPLQLEAKEQQVWDQLTRIGGLELPPISTILGSEKSREYRNKLEFTFSNRRWIEDLSSEGELTPNERVGLGFHIAGHFDKVLDIKKCHLQAEPSNEIRNFVKQYALDNNLEFFNLKSQEGFLRTMVVRTTSTGEVMVIMVFAKELKEERENLLNALQNQFPSITSLNWVINQKMNDSIADLPTHNWSGNTHIFEKMEELRFRIAPKSFYQTNSAQAYNLYKIVREMASLTGDQVVYDLYTGAGTIALFLASLAKKVVGIEYVDDAVEDARTNAQLNQIENCTFVAGDMRRVLSSQFIEEQGHPDVIVLDPPRAGIHPDVAQVIAECAPEKIVYVSCNPATQARDIALMGENYRVVKVQPVDMFPHTHHLENIVLLEKRSDE